MIDLSQELIFSLILKAFFTGAALGLSHEGVSICKMLLGMGSGGRARKVAFFAFTFITDLVFCILGAVAAILLTYNLSGGVFRGCVYLSMGLGLLTYRLTLCKPIRKIELALVKLIKKITRTVIKLVLMPIRAIFSLVCRLYGLTIGRIIGKIRCSINLRREKRKQEAEKKRAAEILPASDNGNGKKEESDAEKAVRYKKECRISFGGKRSA